MVMWMMIILLQLVLYAAASPSPSSIDTVMCHPYDRDALLSFKAALSIHNSSKSDICDDEGIRSYARTESWEKDANCCEWDGVVCDPQTGHVVELDLFCSLLSGSIPSNTTLFRLPNLQGLGLGGNFLSGQVPSEIGWLSHLKGLDLSFNDQLTMPNFQTIISNLTDLVILELSEVSIASHLPQFIFNSSNLAYLGLVGCNLEGELPAMHMLASFRVISLGYNMLTGIIPGWLFTLPSLDYLSLSENHFTGIAQFDIGNTSSMTWFDAESNHLQGQIPLDIFEFYNLQSLNLEKNNLTGTIPLSKIQKLQSLFRLMLSDNSLSVIDDTITNSALSWPSFEILSLSSCHLGHFPLFLREQVNLTWLELSNNGIHDVMPDWLLTIEPLEHLNLSHNLLYGGLEHLPWQNMYEIDIQYNLLHGAVPIPSPTTQYFWASNNHFSGTIPASLCNVSELVILNLAQNKLIGDIPKCFEFLINNQLEVLDIRQNQLHGAIPSSLFQECPNLSGISLSNNRLEGQIPQSINNCSHLELLDLSNNNLNDKFPNWLGSLSFLRELILASNKLHGSLMASNTISSFQMLQILDISKNDFTGNLPVELLMSMKTMAKVDNTLPLSYMRSAMPYQDSINMWIKGVTRRLDAIYGEMVLIDASRNKLEGPIPDAIGDLVALRGLNLAHNSFTGRIPPSLSNLSVLESLDLSFNKLEGRIPTELVNLNSLEFFNVSENDLVGAVPSGKQFDTFSDSSYLGNPGLCGPLLTHKCGKAGDIPPNSTTTEGSSDESSGLQVWEIVLMGCGSGMIAGLAWGYFIFWVKSPYWVQWLIVQIESLIMVYQWRKHQNKRRGTKKRST